MAVLRYKLLIAVACLCSVSADRRRGRQSNATAVLQPDIPKDSSASAGLVKAAPQVPEHAADVQGARATALRSILEYDQTLIGEEHLRTSIATAKGVLSGSSPPLQHCLL